MKITEFKIQRLRKTNSATLPLPLTEIQLRDERGLCPVATVCCHLYCLTH
jgi:hypothetical protein